MRVDYAALVVSRFPRNLATEDVLSDRLGLREPITRQLIGIALEHQSHLNEIRVGGCADVLRVVEYLGSSMLHLAVADRVHSSRAIATAAEASRKIEAGVGEAYSGLEKALEIGRRVRLGASMRGQEGQPSDTVLRTITGQLAGAYAIGAGYAKLSKLVAEQLPILREAVPSIDFKTALQAYAQSRGRQPWYALIEDTGPEHAKIFTAEVRVDTGRTCRGSGGSKKLAEQKAAEQYLSRFAPNFRTVSPPPAVRPIHWPAERLSIARATALESLAAKLGLSQDASGPLNTALTHSSYHSQEGHVADNTVLANLGSWVIDGIVSWQLMMMLLLTANSEVNAREFRSNVAAIVSKNNTHLQRASDTLKLNHYLRVGPAIKEVNSAMRAEAFQALMGAVFIASTRPEVITNLLPSHLGDWLDGAILHQNPILVVRQGGLPSEPPADSPKLPTSTDKNSRMAAAASAGSATALPPAKDPSEQAGSATGLRVPTERLPFTLLAPGTWDIREVVEHYHQAAHRGESGWDARDLDPTRLEKIARLKPVRCYVGKDSWTGYVVFEFSHTKQVVLECPIEGNATYILSGDWRRMVSRTKAEIRQQYAQHYIRIVHKGDWFDRIRQALC